MRLSSVWLFVSLTLSGIALGQTTGNIDFQNALYAARYPLMLVGNAYSGPGAAILNDAVAESRFVLVGEDHFTRETPEFVGALCDQMHPDAYSVEAGPSAARYVNGLLQNPGRLNAMAARNNQYPNGMAFLDMREENDLAVHCAASSRNPHFALWGLDQEFIGSAGVLLAEMAASHPGSKSLAAIQSAQAEERADAAQALHSGDFQQLFLDSLKSAETIRRLNEAVAIDGKPETREIAKELSDSWEIYKLHEEANLGATLEARAELLKQHFLHKYVPFRAQNPNARILFKLGDNHTGKGFNETHDLNLGNFVSELAAAEQVRSLHIVVLALRGMHYTMPAYGKPMGQEPFVMSDDPYYAWMGTLTGAMVPQPADSTGTMLTLIDLRKLRYRHLSLPPEWERVIYSNDLLVVFPNFSVGSEIR